MAPKPRFADGEKVLCFHGPLLYEAKCLRSQIKEKHLKYFIHYSGWNKNWDEWVPECRVLKYNDANLQKQKELGKFHMKSKKSKSGKIITKKDPDTKEAGPSQVQDKTPKQKPAEKRAGSSPITVTDQSSPELPETKKSKTKIEPRFEEEAEVEVNMKINIPQELQTWLIDDWDLINRQKKILKVPARITVDHIIASYVREKVSIKTLPPTVESTIVQVSNRIRDCFNVLLGKSVLYKFERPQYSEMLTDFRDLRMCQIYGAVHLLRMFTRIGNMLVSVSAPGTNFSKLVNHFEDFIRYMSANPSFFNLDDYIVASPEYHRRAL